jgi:raffinose/stachyose/melibiose transport system substrate-binding protein
VTNETLAAAQQAAAENGLMDFIANATGTIFLESGGWTPELQKMVGAQQTAEGLLQTVQATYEESLGQ